MTWPWRTMPSMFWKRKAAPVPAEPEPAAGFVCSNCGRSDLPEAGDWDPPICQECDAAINEDAIRELEASEDEA